MLSRARRVLAYVPRVLVALAIFLVSGEILARALDVVDRLNGFNRFLYARGPSYELPYVLRPGLSVTLFGVPVHVNSLGLREREIDVVPKPGTHRILMIGDSVLFGTVLRAEDRVSDRMQRELDAVAPGRYEVVNAGVPGFNTVGEVRYLEERGLALHPTTVILAFSLNDYEDMPHMSPIGVLSRGIRDTAAACWNGRSSCSFCAGWWPTSAGRSGISSSRRPRTGSSIPRPTRAAPKRGWIDG